ncbi:MAG: co-chaperone GroES [Thermoplasmata archaeon]
MVKTPIQPVGDRVLLKKLEKPEKTAGGIYLPETKEELLEGEVVALGSGRILQDGKRVEFEYKVGDRVLYKKYAGTDLLIGDVKYVILGQDDIVAKYL